MVSCLFVLNVCIIIRIASYIIIMIVPIMYYGLNCNSSQFHNHSALISQDSYIINSKSRKEIGITIKSKEISSQLKLVRNSYVVIMCQPVTASSNI